MLAYVCHSVFGTFIGQDLTAESPPESRLAYVEAYRRTITGEPKTAESQNASTSIIIKRTKKRHLVAKTRDHLEYCSDLRTGEQDTLLDWLAVWLSDVYGRPSHDLPDIVLEYLADSEVRTLRVAFDPQPVDKPALLPVTPNWGSLASSNEWKFAARPDVTDLRVFQCGPLNQVLVAYYKHRGAPTSQYHWVAINAATSRTLLWYTGPSGLAPCVASSMLDGVKFQIAVSRTNVSASGFDFDGDGDEEDDDSFREVHRISSQRIRTTGSVVVPGDAGNVNMSFCGCNTFDGNNIKTCVEATYALMESEAPRNATIGALFARLRRIRESLPPHSDRDDLSNTWLSLAKLQACWSLLTEVREEGYNVQIPVTALSRIEQQARVEIAAAATAEVEQSASKRRKVDMDAEA